MSTGRSGHVGAEAPRFVGDLERWQRWQDSRAPLRAVKHRLRPPDRQGGTLLLGSAQPRLLCVLEGASPSNLAAVARVLAHRPLEEWAILTRTQVVAQLDPELQAHPWNSSTWDAARHAPSSLQGVRAVFSAAHYTDLGAMAHQYALSRDLPHVLVQHGLLTPLTPPLVPGLHVLAWSASDAAYWNADGCAETTVVGSQLFWETAQKLGERTGPNKPDEGLMFLGQLHGAELPTRDLARSSATFCREHNARYRPHPGERDRISRMIHARWHRQGIRFDPGTSPLAQNRTPVVSIFSTGVLEAAARGVPGWVSYDAGKPPAWLEAFWERYALSRFAGGDTDPTPPPALPSAEPARAIADLLGRYL